MKILESLSAIPRKSYRLATAPLRESKNVLLGYDRLKKETKEMELQRSIVAQALTQLHEKLAQPHEAVQSRMVSGTEHFAVHIGTNYVVNFYFIKLTESFRVSIEERVVGDYGKVASKLFGPLLLAKRHNTVRPLQTQDLFIPQTSPDHSRRELIDLLEVLWEVYLRISK